MVLIRLLNFPTWNNYKSRAYQKVVMSFPCSNVNSSQYICLKGWRQLILRFDFQKLFAFTVWECYSIYHIFVVFVLHLCFCLKKFKSEVISFGITKIIHGSAKHLWRSFFGKNSNRFWSFTIFAKSPIGLVDRVLRLIPSWHLPAQS